MTPSAQGNQSQIAGNVSRIFSSSWFVTLFVLINYITSHPLYRSVIDDRLNGYMLTILTCMFTCWGGGGVGGGWCRGAVIWFCPQLFLSLPPPPAFKLAARPCVIVTTLILFSRRYTSKILPIRRKTQNNQSKYLFCLSISYST